MASTINASTSGGLVTTADTSGVLQLQTANTTAVTIDASQNVGIGTTSPARQLVVYAPSSASATIQLADSVSGVGAAAGSIIQQSFADQSMIVRNYAAAGYIRFDTVGASEKMRLDASGNLGLGVTPSAWTNTTVIELGNNTTYGNGWIGSSTGAGSLYLGANCYYDGSFRYKRSSLATYYNQNESGSGEHRWYTAGTGTAGNTITFTQAMTLNANGNLGIGTSSPSQALTVNGAVGYNAPVTVTGATYSVLTTDNWIIANRAGTVTLTLPTASSFTGRILTIKNVQAQTVVSNASNVVPIGSTTAGTAILTNTAGKFATLVSDGTNWIIMQAN